MALLQIAKSKTRPPSGEYARCSRHVVERTLAAFARFSSGVPLGSPTVRRKARKVVPLCPSPSLSRVPGNRCKGLKKFRQLKINFLNSQNLSLFLLFQLHLPDALFSLAPNLAQFLYAQLPLGFQSSPTLLRSSFLRSFLFLSPLAFFLDALERNVTSVHSLKSLKSFKIQPVIVLLAPGTRP